MPLHQVFPSYGSGKFLRCFGFLLTPAINVMVMTIERIVQLLLLFLLLGYGSFIRSHLFLVFFLLLIATSSFFFSFLWFLVFVSLGYCLQKILVVLRVFIFNQPQIYTYNLSLNVIQIAYETDREVRQSACLQDHAGSSSCSSLPLLHL